MARHPEKHTPPRSFKPPPDLYAKAKAKAQRRGETITQVLVRALERYVDDEEE